MANIGEIEVYRSSMEIGTSYYLVLATRKVGHYSKQKYYAPIDKIKYVGEFIGSKSWGIAMVHRILVCIKSVML